MVDGSLNFSLCVSLSLYLTLNYLYFLSVYLPLSFQPPSCILSFYLSHSLSQTHSFFLAFSHPLAHAHPFSHAQFFVGFSPRNQSTRGLSSSSCLSLSLSSCCRCCSFRHTFSILSGSRSDPRKMEKRIFYFQEISLTFVLAHWAYRHHKLTFWCLRSSDTKKKTFCQYEKVY